MTSWQDTLLQALAERDAKEKAFAGIIEQYKRLSQTASLLKERNINLLKASDAAAVTPTAAKGNTNNTNTSDGNPVRAAYIASLEAQVATQREELSTLYKTQSHNAQKLVTLSETLRQTEDKTRHVNEQLRSLQLEHDRLTRKWQDSQHLVQEKEKVIQHLNDELATAHLELTQLEKKNVDLAKDNKNLLQRWLDRMNDEVAQINEANAFIESAARLKAEQEAAKMGPPSTSASTDDKKTSSKTKTPRTSTATPTSETSRSRPSSPSRSSVRSMTASMTGRRTPTATPTQKSAKSKITAPPTPKSSSLLTPRGSAAKLRTDL